MIPFNVPFNHPHAMANAPQPSEATQAALVPPMGNLSLDNPQPAPANESSPPADDFDEDRMSCGGLPVTPPRGLPVTPPRDLYRDPKSSESSPASSAKGHEISNLKVRVTKLDNMQTETKGRLENFERTTNQSLDSFDNRLMNVENRLEIFQNTTNHRFTNVENRLGSLEVGLAANTAAVSNMNDNIKEIIEVLRQRMNGPA